MTNSEREALVKLCRQREKLAKLEADARAAEMRADFEKQLAAIHSYNDHAVWHRAYEIANDAVREAQKLIEASLKDLGIPRQFAPQLGLRWYGRGENAASERRAELIRVATSRIDAITKHAKHQIEATSVDVQTRLLAGALESDDARQFLESMPAAASLMPLFTSAEVAMIAGTVPVENAESVEADSNEAV